MDKTKNGPTVHSNRSLDGQNCGRNRGLDHKLDGALVNKLDRGPKRRQDCGSDFVPDYGPKNRFEEPVVIKFEKP